MDYGRLVSTESLRSDFDGDVSNRSFTPCIVSSDILQPPACCARRPPVVSNSLTNFWMQHFDGARLSPNSVRNAAWHALHEPVCQYLRKSSTRCSTVYIFTQAAFDSQLPRCGNAEHRQMQVTVRVQYTARGPCCFPSLPVCVYEFSSHYLNNIIFCRQ